MQSAPSHRYGNWKILVLALEELSSVCAFDSDVFISGNEDLTVHMASNIKTTAIIIYGVYILAANSFKIASRAAASGALLTLSARLSIFVNTNVPRIIGLMIPPTLLQTPIILMRCAALSI